jgi:endonuclease/exonuclease/phosphatase family metal-dependent hydrolase
MAWEVELHNPSASRIAAGNRLRAVDVKVRGKTARFANTHLEVFSTPVRNAQGRELAAALATFTHPVVLVGDLNSRPDDTAGAYGTLSGAGYADA